jgi:His-Xaa-Ser system protein HxsD
MENQAIEIIVSTTLYDKEAIFAAAYTLTGLYSVTLNQESNDNIKIILKPLNYNRDYCPEEISTRFLNEIIDQQLRLYLERRYCKIRELIIQHAFSPLENLQDKVQEIVGRE